MEEWKITELIQGMHSLRMLQGREDVVEDKADHNFLKTLLVDLPPLEGEVPIKKAIKVPIS